jgi:hypothetical protein
MWKQFLDLIPHLTRLLPHIDRIITQRTSGDDAQKKNLEQFQQMTEGLHADLAQATASHASLYRQLNEQGEKLSELASSLTSTKIVIDSLDARLTRMERIQDKQTLYLLICLLLLVVLFVSLPFWLHLKTFWAHQ